MKMKVLVINGPNLNLIGIREKNIYGEQSYEALEELIANAFETYEVDGEVYQSNHEGDLVDRIQEAYYDGTDAIVINPAAYTHTSVAILDALRAVGLPAVEVHLSNLRERELFRQISFAGQACEKTIMGVGFLGYVEAIAYLAEKYKNKSSKI